MKKILCMLLVGLSLCARAQIRDTLIISHNDIAIEFDGQYHHVRYGTKHIIEEGAPELPVVKRQYYIPSWATNLQFEINVLNEEVLPGNFNIYPSQGLIPMNETEKEFIELNEKWRDQLYPTLASEISEDEVLFGHRIITIAYYPFVYNASIGELAVRDVEISLNYSASESEIIENSLQSKYRRNVPDNYIRNIIENPEMFLAEQQVVQQRASSMLRGVTSPPYVQPAPNFIIITNQELKTAFSPLADWKTRRGIFTIIETVEYIDSNYSGSDLCEKIRNYIIEKEGQWGNGLAILLGGGIDIIPSRLFSGSSDYEVSDVYYVARNELAPNVSTTPSPQNINSIIGRFPVDNIAEAKIMINRTIEYEKAQNDIDYNYINNHLIWQAFLKSSGNSFTDGDKMDHVYNKVNTLPMNNWFLLDAFNLNNSVQYNGITYSFSRTNNNISTGGELSAQSVLDALSVGHDSWGMFHFIYHLDHSHQYGMGTSQLLKNQYISNVDVEKLNCTKGYSQVILSLGCHPADFRTDCIAHSFLTSPNCNAVAFMGNTDLGWQGEYKMADAFYDRMYNHNLKQDWDTQLGWAWLNTLKNSHSNRCRFHLLGDPTLHFWTEVPMQQNNEISINNIDSTIVINKASSLIGETNTVCIYKENELFIVDTVCNRSQAIYDWSEVKTSGYIYITSTGIGMKPQTDSVYIDIEEIGLELVEINVRDIINAYTDSIVSEGETCSVRITYRNSNSYSLSGVTSYLTCDNPDIEILSSPISLSSISGGGQAIGTHRLKVHSDMSTHDIHDNNAIRLSVYIAKDTITECIGYYYLDVNSGFVPELTQITTTTTNAETYTRHNVTMSYKITSDVPFVGRYSRLCNCSNADVVILDTMRIGGGLKKKNESFSYSHRIQVPKEFDDYENLTFDVVLEDVFGNTVIKTVRPFNTPRTPLVGRYIKLFAESDHIDISWPNEMGSSWNIYYSTDNISYSLLNSTPITGNHYRHDNIEPFTKYYYKLARVELGIIGGLSVPVSTSSLAKVMDGFPKFLYGNMAFRGLTNSWDVDLDGKQEVFSTYWNWDEEKAGIIAVRPSGEDLYESGSRMIDDLISINGIYTNGPAIGELYDDGEQYVIGSTFSDVSSVHGKISCHAVIDKNDDGYSDLYWIKDSLIYNSPRSPIIADLDNDDINEIIVPSSKGRIAILNANGSIRKMINSSISYRQLAVANVIPGTENKQLIVPNRKKLEVRDSEGELYPSYTVVFDSALTTPTICDWDNDGYKEAIVCEKYNNAVDSEDSIIVYSVKYLPNTVEVTELFQCDYNCIQGRNDVPIAVGDLNDDNFLELVFMSTKDLYIYNHYSTKKMIRVPATNIKGISPIPVLADIDGDSKTDIVYTTSTKPSNYYCGTINAVNSNGVTIPFEQKIRSYANDALLAADIDNDGYTELVVCVSSGNTIAWKTNGLSDCIEWGCSRANPQNTGEYGQIVYPDIAYGGMYSSPTLSKDLYVMGNSVTIEETLDFEPSRKIVVWENGVLNIDGATLNNARVVVKPGGKVNITDGATINLRDAKSFVVPKGAQLNISKGVIK